MTSSQLKYKDELPLNTINKIRKRLSDLGLLVTETVWKNSVDGFYSVSIKVENTSIATNGKGASSEYALASAYGELMERLQNQATFRLNLDLSPDALEYQGFYYAPDEKKLSINDIINSGEDWINLQMSRLDPSTDKRQLLKLWQAVSYEDVPADFIALPYFSLNTKRLSYIPVKMISKMYMSNGMCAGNTPEEALVQGLSEVMERYVNKRVIYEKITPPSIPHDYLEQFPQIVSMISEVKASGNFDVDLKDCSLGQGLPVVGVIFINKSDQTYFVKFGAHPIFEIAAERTLTELLQGQDIGNMLGVREYSYKLDLNDEAANLMGILVNGSGCYPAEFFSRNFTYPFNGFKDVSNLSNRDMLKYIVELLAENQRQVFVRDVSFLGFPSFHIIVPGMSEIEEINDIKAITDYAEYNKIRKYIRNLEQTDKREATEINDFITRFSYSSEASVADILNLPMRRPLPWYYANIDLFITALYYRIGDFTNAYKAFDKYLRYIQSTQNNNNLVTYYRCVKDYIGTRIDQLSESETFESLSVFYPPEVIQGVINEFGNQELLLSYLGQFNCWNCDSCHFQIACLYKGIEKVYRILKDNYVANKVDQDHLRLTLSL